MVTHVDNEIFINVDQRNEAAQTADPSIKRKKLRPKLIRSNSMLPTALLTAFFLFSLYTMCTMQAYNEQRIIAFLKDKNMMKPHQHEGTEVEVSAWSLPDLTLDFVNRHNISISDDWAEVGLYVALYGLLLFTFVHSLNVVLWRRIVMVYGTTLLFRGILLLSTGLPTSQSDGLCVSKITGNPLVEGFLIMTKIHVCCHDMMFSGHTAAQINAMCFFIGYLRTFFTHKGKCLTCDGVLDISGSFEERKKTRLCHCSKWNWFTRLLVPVCIIQLILIGLTKLHYTIDILVGTWTSFSLYCLYHALIHSSAFKRSNSNVYIFLRWVEAPGANETLARWTKPIRSGIWRVVKSITSVNCCAPPQEKGEKRRMLDLENGMIESQKNLSFSRMEEKLREGNKVDEML